MRIEIITQVSNKSFKASRLLYVPPGLTFKNSTWCSHCVYVFCADLTADNYFRFTQH